jgi:hypothetical protein
MKSDYKKELEISFKSPTTKESLPLPFVHYPDHYGYYMSFSETENSARFICSCSKESLHFYLKNEKAIDEGDHVLINMFTRRNFSTDIQETKGVAVPFNSVFKFKDNLCHICNQVKPSLIWCHPMYGNKFVQNYGWYIHQTIYKHGLVDETLLHDNCPRSLIELIKSQTESGTLKIKRDWEDEFYFDDYEWGKGSKLIEKYAEISLREKIENRKVLNEWVNEKILFNVLDKMGRSRGSLVKAHKFEWLPNVTFNYYLPEQSIAILCRYKKYSMAMNDVKETQKMQRIIAQEHEIKALCEANSIELKMVDQTEHCTVKKVLAQITN